MRAAFAQSRSIREPLLADLHRRSKHDSWALCRLDGFDELRVTSSACSPAESYGAESPGKVTQMEKQLMTREEFRATYSIGFTTLHKLINRGDIVRVKVGRKTLIPVESAKQWAAALQAPKINSDR